MSDNERRSGTVPAVTASTERGEVVVTRTQPGSTRQVRSTFHFDHVLSSYSSQNDVFSATLKPLVQDVLSGYEAAAFAYGQTGTGKTYTMEGQLESEEGRGLVPRAAAAVIQAAVTGRFSSVEMHASCLEIYNEELTDLLSSTPNQKLDLKETGRGVACIGLSELKVASVNDVQELIRSAQDRRRVAETRVHARSSRSHCLFTLKVCCRERVPGGEVENTGKLHLVDLAGSECAKKAQGERQGTLVGHGLEAERERRNINQSLLTLGRVIAALRDDSGRVPYRDSKLTRLLQDALGGSCRTVMIATISPAQSAVDETVSTLTYAEQAMGITTKPMQASVMHGGRFVPGAPFQSLSGTDLSVQGMNCEAGELELKLEYLAQEVEEARSALERKRLEAEALRRKTEEGAFVANRLADFADKRTSQAASLASALDAVGQRNSTLRERCRSMIGAMRTQVAELIAAGDSQVKVWTDAACKEGSGLCALARNERESQRRSLDTLWQAMGKQQQLVGEVAGAVREAAKQLREDMGAASVEAFEAGAADLASAGQQLAGIKDNIHCTETASATGLARIEDFTERLGSQHSSRVVALQSALRSGSDALSSAAAQAVGELGKTQVALCSSEEEVQTRLDGSLRAPLVQLGAGLDCLRAKVLEHGRSIDSARAQHAGEDAVAADQRSTLHGALCRLGGEQSASLEFQHSQLTEALGSVESLLQQGSAAAQDRWSALSDGLAAKGSDLTEGREHYAAQLRSAVQVGDTLLSTAWDDANHKLARLQGSLGAFATAEERTSFGTEAVLTETLWSVVSALDAQRSEISLEVARLRELRGKEEAIVQTLARQRETLQADVAQARCSLDKVCTDLAASQAAFQRAEEEQGARREASVQNVVRGVESLLRGEFESIAANLASSSESIRDRLEGVVNDSAAMSFALQSSESNVLTLSDEVQQLAASWAAASHSSCEKITLGLEGVEQSTRRVDVDAVALVDSAALAAGEIRAAEGAVRGQWAGVRDEAQSAASAWASHSETVERALLDAGAGASRSATALASMHADVFQQIVKTHEQATAWASEDQLCLSEVARQADLQEVQAQEANAIMASRLAAMSASAQHAEELAMEVGRLTTAVPELQHAVDAHGAAFVFDSDARMAEIAATADAVRTFAAQGQSTMTDSLDSVTELGITNQESCRAVRSVAAEAWDVVSTSAAAATGLLEAQRAAVKAAQVASERRWGDLESALHVALKSIEAVALEAVDRGGTLANDCLTSQRQCEEEVGAAHQALLSGLQDSSLSHARALGEQQLLWNKGLAAAPIDAFGVVPSFEDDTARVVEACCFEMPPRPSEQSLAEEFRGRLPILASDDRAPLRELQSIADQDLVASKRENII